MRLEQRGGVGPAGEGSEAAWGPGPGLCGVVRLRGGVRRAPVAAPVREAGLARMLWAALRGGVGAGGKRVSVLEVSRLWRLRGSEIRGVWSLIHSWGL